MPIEKNLYRNWIGPIGNNPIFQSNNSNILNVKYKIKYEESVCIPVLFDLHYVFHGNFFLMLQTSAASRSFLMVSTDANVDDITFFIDFEKGTADADSGRYVPRSPTTFALITEKQRNYQNIRLY